MRKIRGLLCIATIILSVAWTNKTLASRYAGAQRPISVNGVTALISTPQNPLNLIEVASSGVSNWVATYDSDVDGQRDWLQAGWKFYWWYSIPKQYVEWCIDCIGDQGIYEMKDQFANQNWGTTIDYWVDRDVNARWCAYTSGYLRYCVDDLHTNPVEVYALSEVHDSPMNPLDTTFNQVRYKDPADGIWKLFDNQVIWVEDFPYDTEIFSNSHFRTFRMETYDIFLPTIVW